ncbi:MAG: DUF3341 domain-containing protein [bacterium]|nr:DUF3341 domain-containing protein [bacterium]
MPLLVPELPEGNKHFGALARFGDARELYHACEKVRDAGYKKWDAHTPFPVHGLDHAMGLRSSKLPWIVFVMGMGGATGGMLMQWWVATQAYPLVISGKPLFSWQAFVPVTFELGVLFGALGAVFGMLAMNQLPMLFHPLFKSKSFERVTDDGFFISIESWDPKFDSTQTVELLKQAGAADVELIEN